MQENGIWNYYCKKVGFGEDLKLNSMPKDGTKVSVIDFSLSGRLADVMWPISQSHFHVPHLCSLK